MITHAQIREATNEYQRVVAEGTDPFEDWLRDQGIEADALALLASEEIVHMVHHTPAGVSAMDMLAAAFVTGFGAGWTSARHLAPQPAE